MAYPRGRECSREVAVDAVTEADQDARREPGFRLGQDPGKGLGGAPTEVLESPTQVHRAGFGLHRASRERADRSDPLQVLAVWRIGTGPDRAVQPQAVTRDNRRIPGQRRRDRELRHHPRHRPECRRLMAFARRTGGEDHE